jgi:hypothetical protein
MTFWATSLVKAVIPARSLPSTTIGGWNPGEVKEKNLAAEVVEKTFILDNLNSYSLSFFPCLPCVPWAILFWIS